MRNFFTIFLHRILGLGSKLCWLLFGNITEFTFLFISNNLLLKIYYEIVLKTLLT